VKPFVLCLLGIGVAIQGQPDQKWTPQARQEALRRAIIWQSPPVPIESADLTSTPEGVPDDLHCRFKVDDVGGMTPKFECQLRGGEVVKVKYAGAEPYGEVAATRLLRALGFGADRVDLARRVRCYGCPRFPFPVLKVVTLVGADRLFERGLDFDTAIDFEWAAVERRHGQLAIETGEVEGWAFHELARVPTASRTHRDALMLMAVFLAHWDNKADNQRLLCLGGRRRTDGRCLRPLAMLQDVGGTFGPRKTDLSGWRSAPIWRDRATCTVSMATLPHGGATFVDTAVTEQGRRFLASLLTRLTKDQIEALFRAARFDQHDGSIPGWTATFRDRVRAIADGPPCPK
jgi:hypothetical protein